MHHIYTTKAFIIKGLATGEANKYYLLLTCDLGFIKATAQGVRLQKSKLKGHLQDYLLASLSLVRGRDVWRVVGAETLEYISVSDTSKLIAIKNTFSLLLRLLHGEEKNEALFNSVESFYNFLLKNELSVDDIHNLETITVLRILYHLGYFKKSFDLFDFVMDNDLSVKKLNLFDDKKKMAILDINNALKESHL